MAAPEHRGEPTFPLYDERRQPPFPTFACQSCGCERVPTRTDVWLTAGALIGENPRESAGTDERMIGFLSLAYHRVVDPPVGTHNDVFTSLSVVEDAEDGQFDLRFCSTACLRVFWNRTIDAMETRIDEEERKAAARRQQAMTGGGAVE